MLQKFEILALLCFFAFVPGAQAQSNLDKTVETFSATIGTIGLGTPEYDFFTQKSHLKKRDSGMEGGRDEVFEQVQKNGIESFTYYFVGAEQHALYEIIVALDDETTCSALAEKLLGAPNYPDRPNYWIAGAAENVVTLAWTYGNKFVLAANLPQSDWIGDPMFTLPPGFEPYKHLPNMSSWAPEDLARFISTLERQVSVGAANFEPIRGVETDGYYTCTEPLAGAEAAAIFQGDDNKWVVGNTIVSGASAENAILWKLDAAQFLGTAPTGNLKLTRVNAKPAFGALVELWDISDKQGKPTGLQLGIMEYEWNADGLWNVDILILQQ